MDRESTRRALLASIVGGVAAAGVLSPVRTYLEGFAPVSGGVWDGARPDRTTRSSPYGDAIVRHDDYGVPHVKAETEDAAYYAIGYSQAADRLFQLDLQRRQMRGELSAVVGPATLDSDEFHIRMAFDDAADATWARVQGTPAGDRIEAYVDGVNARIAERTLPLEFDLLGFEPDPWTPADTLLTEKQISWALTGSFRTLRKAAIADELGADAADELYPDRYDHDSPILREGTDGPAGDRETIAEPPEQDHLGDVSRSIDPAFVDHLSQFESPPGIGSNSWIVSGDHTDSGEPILANDPHLLLQAPAIWYEQRVETPAADVRGVTFPGVPFVIIGRSDRASWGFTNAGADVIDFYTYETDESGNRYRYDGEWREYETEERRIRVAGGEDRSIVRRRTVHGPVIQRHGSEVAVAWTGHGGTRTTEAIYQYPRTADFDEFLEATQLFDLPTQCLVYADDDGRTAHYVTGQVPIRRTDGQAVPGNQVFDGSAGEGEWAGFEPFGAPEWEGDGFIPFEEMPHAIDPDALGTANQRIIDDDRYPYYFAESYGAPYRGQRLYDLLDDRLASTEPVTPEFVRKMQRDTLDGRAEQFVPLFAAAVREESSDRALADAIATLESWDGGMDRESEAALIFVYALQAYRELVFDDLLDEAGFPGQYPSDWVLADLDPESRWFGDRDRDALLREALTSALEQIDDAGINVYGDENTTGAITHPFGLEFLNYPSYPTDGSPTTLRNYRVNGVAGSSWRMLWSPDGTSEAILPGGNSGRYFSPHYADQLRLWADGEYKPLSLAHPDTVRYEFGGSQ